jgi:hypothetical protein
MKEHVNTEAATTRMQRIERDDGHPFARHVLDEHGPGGGAPVFLPRALPPGMALQMLMRGDPITAREASRGEAPDLSQPFQDSRVACVVAVFKAVEHVIKGLWNGLGLAGGLAALSEKWSHELLPNSLIVFAALIFFFAVTPAWRPIARSWPGCARRSR